MERNAPLPRRSPGPRILTIADCCVAGDLVHARATRPCSADAIADELAMHPHRTGIASTPDRRPARLHPAERAQPFVSTLVRKDTAAVPGARAGRAAMEPDVALDENRCCSKGVLARRRSRADVGVGRQRRGDPLPFAFFRGSAGSSAHVLSEMRTGCSLFGSKSGKSARASPIFVAAGATRP